MVRVSDSLLPQIAADMGVSVGAASIVVTAYALAHGSVQLIIGPAAGIPDYYGGILGGSACIKHPNRCDLSAGIVTDDAAGRVTFRLVQADPDFLYKLGLTLAVRAEEEHEVLTPARGIILPTPAGARAGELPTYLRHEKTTFVRGISLIEPHWTLSASLFQRRG